MVKKIIGFSICLLVLAIPAVFFAVSDNYFSERTDKYIKQQVVTTASNIFTTMAYDQFTNLDSTSKLVTYVYDEENQVKSILINSVELNKLLALSSTTISTLLESGMIEERIEDISFPLGQLISKSIFASYGPDIHIKTDPISSYKLDIITETTEYGINNVLFEIYMQAIIEIDIMIPLKQSLVVCETKFLLVSQIIQGDVPRYYYKGNGDVLYIPED